MRVFSSRRAAARVATLLGTLAWFAPVSLYAQPYGGPPDADEAPGLTPRSAVRDFLRAARRRDFATASRYIGAPSRAIEPQYRERLARQLQVVLDRRLWVDPATLSDDTAGRLNDGLPSHLEEIGRISGPDGGDAVRLTRLGSGQWVFGRQTVDNVPDWYRALPDRWLYEHLPDWLLRVGPFDVALWQWLALLPAAALCLALGIAAGWLLQLVALPIVRRKVRKTNMQLVGRLRPARNLFMAALIARIALPYAALPPPAEAAVTRAVTALLFGALIWSALRALDLVREIALRSRFVAARRGTAALLPLATRIGKVAIFAVSAVMLLQWLGLPVASLITGLGIGGLAVALAARPTLENLLASVTLGIDQPFRPGDLVAIDTTMGTVESVGLRSTRIRTLDRTLISIPNGKLADMRIESYAARDRIRFATTLALHHATSRTQLRAVLAGVERVLRDHPQIWPETVVVRLKDFSPASLDVEVMAWFLTADHAEFQQYRQDVLFDALAVVERCRVLFANQSAPATSTEGTGA